MVYLDDIIVFGKNLDEHMKRIEDVIRKLSQNNFRVNQNKIQYCKNEVRVLGKKLMTKKKLP